MSAYTPAANRRRPRRERGYHRAHRSRLAFHDLAGGMGALTPILTPDPAPLEGGPR